MGKSKLKLLLLLGTEFNILTVGGDGPKLIDLLQMREKHLLQDRIELRGSIKHEDVRSVSLHALFLQTFI